MDDSFRGYPDKVMKAVRSCEDQIRNSNFEIRNKFGIRSREFETPLFRISRFEFRIWRKTCPPEEKIVKRSAGTLLYRQGPKGLEVLLVHPSGNYNRKAPWGIPKGELEGDAGLEETARRETQEETGVTAGELRELGFID